MSWYGPQEKGKICEQPVFQPVRMVSRGDPTGENRPGVITGESEKEMYAKVLGDALRIGTLVYAKHIVGQNLETDMKELSLEMKNFRRHLKMPKDGVFGKIKETFSGKDKTGAKKDDRVLALQMGGYLSRLEIMRTEVQELAEQYNIKLA